MTPTKESQTSRILRLLKRNKVVTSNELNNICYRYSARIHELRNDGYIIVTNRLKGGLYGFVYRGHVDDKVMEYSD